MTNKCERCGGAFDAKGHGTKFAMKNQNKGREFMTFEELKQSDKEFVVATDIAKIVGCAPYALILTARDQPEKLGFPVMVMGKRVRFPRRAFIKWVEGDRS